MGLYGTGTLQNVLTTAYRVDYDRHLRKKKKTQKNPKYESHKRICIRNLEINFVQ